MCPVLVDTLAKVFGKDIEVTANPTEFLFRQGDAVLSLRPLVTVSSETPPKVLAVGERVAVTQVAVVVDLFDSRSAEAHTGLKNDCLEAFFRYAFARLANRATIIRPRVIVSVTRELSHILCGYEAPIFAAALVRAGARECVVRAA